MVSDAELRDLQLGKLTAAQLVELQLPRMAGTGNSFKDCDTCPEMVVVPAGSFNMGSPADEPEREFTGLKGSESQVYVTLARSLAVGRFAVTRGEFAIFATATGHKIDGGCYVYNENLFMEQANRNWHSPGITQTDRDPVVCVSWNDATAYVAWLSSTTGKRYRLLTEAEREYVTRAGTTTPYWWGSAITPKQANYGGLTDPNKGGGTVPVDSFESNPWGLYNVHGNVWEWTEDCWNTSNAGNPGDGTARVIGDCGKRVLRGGSWYTVPQALRSANRSGAYFFDHHTVDMGFRVARILE
jgi:formylglycine-generating enzyme required for sulfatase activity